MTKTGEKLLRAVREAVEIAKIHGNCAKGKDCECGLKAKPWLCENWGKSRLNAPNVISAYAKRG